MTEENSEKIAELNKEHVGKRFWVDDEEYVVTWVCDEKYLHATPLSCPTGLTSDEFEIASVLGVSQ